MKQLNEEELPEEEKVSLRKKYANAVIYFELTASRFRTALSQKNNCLCLKLLLPKYVFLKLSAPPSTLTFPAGR